MDTTTMTAMGTTPRHKDLHTREPIPTHAIPHSINPMENPTPSIGQNPATSSHHGGKKETYHLYNQSALYSGQTHPKGKIFQIFKGNFTESSEPYLKTALHSPFPTLRSPFTNHQFQSQTATFSDPKSSDPATTTDLDSSLHNDTLEGLNKAEQGNGTQLVMQKTNFTTRTARPLPDPETVSVPFKPTYYDIWDILKNNSWVTLNAGTSVPLFTSPGTEPAAASGQSVQAGIDVSVSSPAMGNPKGTSTTQQATTNSTAFMGVVSTAPTTKLSSSISTAGSTATGNFLNRLVPAGTWKPGVPGNISHVTEGDKPQHRATICLSKMDIAWIILAISVPISSCCKLISSCFSFSSLETQNMFQLTEVLWEELSICRTV